MSLSISIDAGALKAVMGHCSGRKFVIERCHTIPLNGELQDGQVVAEQAFCDKLKELKNQLATTERDVDAIYCSNTVITKVVEVPAMSTRQLMNIVREELQEFIGENKAFVYDYYVISEDVGTNMGKILCAAMDMNAVQKFKECFLQSGFRLRSFDVGQSAIYKVLENAPVLQKKDYILGNLWGSQFEANLYHDGVFVQSRRTRIEQRESLGMISSISQLLSSLLQYSKSQRTDNEIKQIYISGMREVEREYCNNITNAVGIQTEILSDSQVNVSHSLSDYSIASYIYATGNLNRR